MRYAILGALLMVPMVALSAQSQAPRPESRRFEVASIKPCSDQDPAQFMQMVRLAGVTPNAGSRYYKPCIPVWQLVAFAYNMPLSRLRNRPEWTGREYFEVDARTGTPVSVDVMRVMVRDLLTDRFGFRSHTEVATLDAYALVLTRPDKQLGPDAKPAAVDCSPDSYEAVPDEKAQLRCAVSSIPSPKTGLRTSTYNGMTMVNFAQTLSMLRLGNEVVVDETSLKGAFDMTLEEEPSATGNSRDDAALNRALEKHLGLKLVRRKGPVEVLVIDRFERPSQN